MIRPFILTLALLSGAPVLAQSSTERTDAAITRIRAIDPRLHAVIAIDPMARVQAEAADQIRFFRFDPSAITGEPVLIKDNIDVAGLPTTAGSQALAANLGAGTLSS